MSRVVVLLLLVTVLARLPFLFDAVIDWDESTFLLMGADLLRGHLPYVHAWDNKPPLAFVPFAVVIAIFGKNVVGARLLGIALVFASALLLRRAARRIVRGSAPTWAALILILHSGAPPGVFATMSEHITLPLFCLALDRLLADPVSRRSLSRTGVFLGLMILIRTNMAYAALGFVAALAVLSSKRVVSRILALSFGILLPPALVSLVYAASGQIDLLFRSIVSAPLAYGASGWLSRGEALAEMVRAGLLRETILLSLATLAGTCLLVRDAARGRAELRHLALLGILFLLIAHSTTGSGRYFEHYSIQVLPLAAIAVGRTFSLLAASFLRPILLVGLIVPAYPTLVQCRDLASRLLESGTLFSGPVYSVAESLKGQGAAGDYAFFPEMHVGYLLTDTMIPTRFVHPSLIVNEPVLRAIEGPDATSRSEILSIFEKEPRFVVMRDDVFYLRRRPEAKRLIEEILAKDYAVTESVEAFRIYVRKAS